MFADRLGRVRDALGFATDAAMADELGIPRQNLNSYRVAEQEPQRVSVALLSKFDDRGINLNWLLTGEGPMLREADQMRETPGGAGPSVQANAEEGELVEVLRDNVRLYRLENQRLEHQVQQLQAENAALTERLKKLGEGEKATPIKERG